MFFERTFQLCLVSTFVASETLAFAVLAEPLAILRVRRYLREGHSSSAFLTVNSFFDFFRTFCRRFDWRFALFATPAFSAGREKSRNTRFGQRHFEFFPNDCPES
jgi:hypothetical protein